jgi:hypothetical protein
MLPASGRDGGLGHRGFEVSVHGRRFAYATAKQTWAGGHVMGQGEHETEGLERLVWEFASARDPASSGDQVGRKGKDPGQVVPGRFVGF